MAVADMPDVWLNSKHFSNCMASRQPDIGRYVLLALLGSGLINIILFMLFLTGIGQFVTLYFLILLMSVITVYLDARAINRAKGRGVIGTGSWAVLVWFLWIIAMPWYALSRRGKAISAPVAPNGTSQHILETIRKLGELKETGILTEDEFQRKKQELLSRV